MAQNTPPNLLTHPVHFYMCYTELMFVTAARLFGRKYSTANQATWHTESSSKSEQQFLLVLTLFLYRLICHHIFLNIAASKPRDMNGGPEKELE